MPTEELSFTAWAIAFCLDGVPGAVSKTFTAPIERVKLLLQTQDANPLIRSGEVPRYKGIVDCFSRINSEQGVASLWRGNFTNCIRYFPTQAFILLFKDSIKKMFPKYSPKTEFGMFFAVNMASGSMAAAVSLCIVYPLDYARTRLASDVGGGKKTFNGLLDCLKKTAAGPLGPAGLYAGFGASLAEIILCRGFQLGAFNILVGLNPYKSDQGILGLVSTFFFTQTAIIVGAAITYPFDTVRRRLQMQAEVPKEKHIYNGTFDCLQKIAAEEGVAAGVYKGFLANAFRIVGSSLVFVLYSRSKKY